MAGETTAQRKGEISRSLLQALSTEEEGLQAKNAIDAIAASLGLTAYESGTFDSGDPRFPRIVRFTTITLLHAGWMTKSDGVWSVTTAGRAALDTYADPEALFAAARLLYVAWKKAGKASDPEADDTDEKVETATTLEEASDKARADLLDYLGRIDPFAFQELCRKLIEAFGHEVVWVSPPGPDGGIDLIGYADPIGVNGRRIKGQAKRTPASKQGATDVQQFLSTIASDDVGVFIALGGFTAPAMALVRGDQRRLILIDGARFLELWVEYYDRLDQEGRELLPLKPIYYLDLPD